MENLDRWIAAYVMMDDESRNDHLIFAESSARAHPRRPPILCLAASGSGCAIGLHLLSKPQNVPALALVQREVKLK